MENRSSNLSTTINLANRLLFRKNKTTFKLFFYDYLIYCLLLQRKENIFNCFKIYLLTKIPTHTLIYNIRYYLLTYY